MTFSFAFVFHSRLTDRVVLAPSNSFAVKDKLSRCIKVVLATALSSTSATTLVRPAAVGSCDVGDSHAYSYFRHGFNMFNRRLKSGKGSSVRKQQRSYGQEPHWFPKHGIVTSARGRVH